MNNDKPLQEVAGRTNFSTNQVLVSTPQPCVMIAVGQAWNSGKAFMEQIQQ